MCIYYIPPLLFLFEANCGYTYELISCRALLEISCFVWGPGCRLGPFVIVCGVFCRGWGKDVRRVLLLFISSRDFVTSPSAVKGGARTFLRHTSTALICIQTQDRIPSASDCVVSHICASSSCREFNFSGYVTAYCCVSETASLGLSTTTCCCSVEVTGSPSPSAPSIYLSWKMFLLLHLLQQNFFP